MSDPIELFEVQYSSQPSAAPAVMTCQSISVDGERLLWVDGIDGREPVVVPLAGIKAKWIGSFADYLAQNKAVAERVLLESQGEHSPTILVRAMQVLKADPSLSPADALEMCVGQSDLLREDDRRASAMVN